MNCKKLYECCRPPRIVESPRELGVPLAQQPIDVEVAVVEGPARPRGDLLHLGEHALAEPLESYGMQLSEHLPIGFWEVSAHSYGCAVPTIGTLSVSLPNEPAISCGPL